MPSTAAAAALSGSLKTILSAALLAHPAPAVAEWTQANDLGPTCDSVKTRGEPPAGKGGFFMPVSNGQDCSTREDGHVSCYTLSPSCPPAACDSAQGGFVLDTEHETMKPTTTGQSAQDPTKPAGLFGRSLAVSDEVGVTITRHTDRPHDLLCIRSEQLHALLHLMTDVADFGHYPVAIQGGILELAADLAHDLHLVVSEIRPASLEAAA